MASKVSPKVLYYKFSRKYGFTIGIVFVISTALLIVLLLSKIFHFFYDKYASKRLGTAQIKYLKNMTPEQMTIIREFLREPTHTLPLPMNNGLVIELQHLQILTPAGQTHLVSMLDPQINYFLQPWVIKKINSDEELKRIFY
ncbi:superinfection exclusion B family protein [Blautia sp. AF34-10]|uniref:superinfection exclusion B family protein n=1 Tax=Blautia sp. AF34-10 TaxID=2292968 RepID=UPI003FA420C3